MKLPEWLDYRARYSRAVEQIADLQETVNSAAEQLATCRAENERLTAERNDLRARVERYAKEAIAQAERVAQAQAERNALKLQLDEALAPKMPPTDGAVKKPPRTSRAKPPMNE